jgi:hypothetical protein
MEQSLAYLARCLAAWICSTAISSIAVAQTYPAPVAGSVTGGSFEVSYLPNCTGIPYEVVCAFTYLQEREGSGGQWKSVSSSGGSVAFVDKPQGSYSYRVYLGFYDPRQTLYFLYSPEITVFVSSEGRRADIREQMAYRYAVTQGDSNGDGRLDLYLHRTKGGAPRDGTIDRLVLRQSNDGSSFVPEVPSDAVASFAAGWPQASVDAIVGDVNVDGYVDVTLSRMSAVAGGADDQIVFASGEPGVAEPLAVRAFDDGLGEFTSNMLDYFADQRFFSDNAPRYFYRITFWYAYCDPRFESSTELLYWDYYWDYFAGYHSGCYIDYFSIQGIFQDFSMFSDEAVMFWVNDQDARNGYIDEEEALDGVEVAIEGLLGTAIGGWPMEEILGPEGEHTDPFVRRGIEIGQSVLGQARGGRNSTTSRLIPPQIERLPDNIYITGHPLAFARSRGHLALEFVDSEVVSVPYIGSTISAEPENNNFFNFGKLIARDDRPSDSPLLNYYVGSLEPLNTSKLDYWTNYLRARHANYMALPYSELVTYALVPSASAGTFNSNSYISGVSQDSPSNATIDVPFGIGARYPGWNGPVPDVKFR